MYLSSRQPPRVVTARLATLALYLFVAMAGCATSVRQPNRVSPDVPPEDPVGISAHQESVSIADPADEGDEMATGGGPMLYRGTGEFLDAESGADDDSGDDPEPESGADVTLNFENAEIPQVVATILGEILKKNYLIAPGIAGQLTFSTARPLPRTALIPVLESLLGLHGAALVRDGRVYKVVPVTEAIPGTLRPDIGPVAEENGFQVRAVPLQYVSVAEMQKLLQPFVRQYGIIAQDSARNIMILGGTARELENYLETVRIFDVDWMAGMSVGVFPLREVDAAELVKELDVLFGAGAENPLAGLFRFVPVERLNAIMVVTARPDYLDRAEEWIERLDVGAEDGSGLRLYVYEVQNVKATDLADILTDLFSSTGSTAGTRRKLAGPAVAPGLEPVEVRSLNDPRRSPAETPDPAEAAADSGSAPPGIAAAPAGGGISGEPVVDAGGGMSVVEGEEVRITAVEDSNSLLIRSTPRQYDSIQAAIRRLDTVPLQVMIEARILEVTLGDQLNFGVQWFINDNKGRRTSEFTLGLPLPGADASSFGWKLINGDYSALIRALEQVTTVNVLSSPTLLVLNNKEAQINVGDQVPVITTSVNTGGSADSVSTVQFRDTGVILNVTPRVNPGGLVYLDISQEVSDPGEVEPTTGNRTILRRTIDTEVAVQSGDTIVLGGLIRENQTRGRSGVPGLSRVPVLGVLFGQRTREQRRTELLVVIKPTVVANQEDARAITREYREKFRNIKPLARSF